MAELLADMPLVNALNFEAGFRYSDYGNRTTIDNTGTGGVVAKFSNGFSNWTYKAGLDWEPTSAFRLRAMYQRAVRAPNLFEIGTPVTPGTGDAQFDPCDSTVFNAVGNAALAALCNTVGGGLPAGVTPGNIAPPTAGQVNNASGGNPNLVPEKADTITLGAVLQPGVIPGLTASIDYFDIKVKKAILETPEQAILDACYFAERSATGEFCSFVHRSQVDGSLEGDLIYGVDSFKRNIGLLRARGIDVAIDYTTPISEDVRIMAGVDLTYMLDSKFQYAKVLRAYDCVGKAGKTCLDPQPEWSWNARAGIEVGSFLAQVTWRHVSSIKYDAFSVGYYNPDRSYVLVDKIPSYDWFDLAMRYKINDDFAFRFGIDNVFNKKPPLIGNDYGGTTQNSGNTYPATYDPIGRYFSAGVNFQF